MIKPSITEGSKRVYSMSKLVLAAMSAAFACFVVCGCNDAPRKEVSQEDVCAAYKAQLDAVMNDPTKTEQDKMNAIPYLSGYAACKDKVGTGGLQPGGTAGAPASGASANQMDAQSRSGAAAAGR